MISIDVVLLQVVSALAEIPTAMGTVSEARAATTTTTVLDIDRLLVGGPLRTIRLLAAATMIRTVATTLLRTRT